MIGASVAGASIALASDPTAARMASTIKVGDLLISTPWTRATPKGARVAGGFMRITNTGVVSDRLVGGTFVGAQSVEVHEMAMDGGVMKMRELAKGLEIKPGETIELKPGSYHVMFMGLAGPVPEGTRVAGTLRFERAGTVEVGYHVTAMGAKQGSMDHGGHQMQHGTGHMKQGGHK